MKLPFLSKPKSSQSAIMLANEPRPIMRELGTTGNIISNGILGQQEYNWDLQSPQSYDIYDQMRKADGQVKAALNAIKLPLLSAEWHFEPASKEAQDIEIAEFLEYNMLESMSQSWQSTLRQILLHLDYGSMPFETVWELRDQKVALRKLATRLPKTITEWRLDDNGGLKEVMQMAYASQRYNEVVIPVNKLLVFVNELEGSDYRGISVLRAAYKHWFYKDKMYIIDAIAKERRAIGVDVGTLGTSANKTDQAALEIALMGLHAHEKQFFVEQTDVYSYRIEGLDGQPLSAMDSIEHHDLRILRSVLAEFMAMGSGSTGSLAMHNDKTSFFLMALNGVGKNVTDTINSYLVKRWVDMNWSVTKYPRLVHSKLESRDVLQIAEAVNKLMGVGALTHTQDVEDSVRELLELPDFESAMPMPEDEPELPLLPPPSDVPVEDMISAIAAIQDRQANKLAEVVSLKRDIAPQEITIPYKTEMSSAIAASMPDTWDNKMKAKQIADVVGYRIKLRTIFNARTGVTDTTTLTRKEIYDVVCHYLAEK